MKVPQTAISQTQLLKSRIKKLNTANSTYGKCVIYFMSRDQRVNDNHALIAAKLHSERLKVPLLVIFALYSSVKNRTMNQFKWMIEGLKEVENQLHLLNIPFFIISGKASKVYKSAAEEFGPVAVYFDFSPLKGPIKVKLDFANDSSFPVFMVDTHNIVPVWITSNKQEYAARTIRPKLNKHIQNYLYEPQKINSQNHNLDLKRNNWQKLLAKLKLKTIDNYEPMQISGSQHANTTLINFLKGKLLNYFKNRNNPDIDALTNLSPYLHFGQISSLRVVLELNRYQKMLLEAGISGPSKDDLNNSVNALIEEIIVRKELSDNFCYYNNQYDSLDGAPEWAKKTLQKHKKDKRDYIYTYTQFEKAKTHDPKWNLAQQQMVSTGKMHGYLRMYWAKKILEWTPNATTALNYAIKLNDKYSLDGYDPNGYVGCLWSIAGLHDRPWFERKIFGFIRYMGRAAKKS